MSEMVERVARKIGDELSLHKQGLDWVDKDGPIQRAARAAIEAMREPTQEMVTVAEKQWSAYAAPVWRAMIDAALVAGHGTETTP